MPSFTLTDAARFHISAISFFVFVILVSALVVKWLWNGLRKDFVQLPRLSYGRSLGLVVLIALFFNIFLLMIAGTRELMTPGAWEQSDITYRLRDGGGPVYGQGRDGEPPE